MADTKLADLTALTTPSGDDLLYIVDDPAGIPLDRKIALDNLFTRGTITTSQPVLDASQTWNASGVTFSALKLNVSSTASASFSLLMDLLVGSAKKFSVTKDGIVYSNIASPDSTNFSLWSVNGSTFVNCATGGEIIFGVGNSIYTKTGALGFKIPASSSYSWSSTSDVSATSDVHLYRGGAQILEMRDPLTATSPQTFRVYRDYTNTTNYTRMALKTATGVHTVETESDGTGEANIDLALTPKGTGRVRYGTHAAIGLELVTGYIEIKDAGGTVRKLAVVS